VSDQHPYSLSFERNGFVFISGAVGIDYETHTPVLGDRESVDAALNEVRRRLEAVGLGLSDIVKATYYLTDLKLRDHANDQFEELFAEPRPARTVVKIDDAPFGGRAVIEAIAAR
jgi:2-iminobutanoate/2-iminopropanoate deaminase